MCVNRINNRSNLNGNNNLDINNGRLVGIAQPTTGNLMPPSTYKHICAYENLKLAEKKARKRKTLKPYVIEFERELDKNLLTLQQEIRDLEYKPKPLETFIIRDPKTRKISKSDFRDRIVHHALCNIIEPIIEKRFIYDSFANRKGKGPYNAIERFEKFKRKASRNNTRTCYVLKADIRHYFENVDHDILVKILSGYIPDEQTLHLVKMILDNHKTTIAGKGMPLGNLTSQFFANVYLNELDQYVKHHLKARYYIRYVDDFVILSDQREELQTHEKKIALFLWEFLSLELHPEKTKIVNTNEGVGFLGFRIFPHHKLLRKKNMGRFQKKLRSYHQRYLDSAINRNTVISSLQGWLAYSAQANTYKYRRHIVKQFNQHFSKPHNESPSKATNDTSLEKRDDAPVVPTHIAKRKQSQSFQRQIDEADTPFTIQKTRKLLNSGIPIERIAQQRGIKINTVWEHLAKLIEYNQIPIRKIIPQEKIKLILPAILSEKDYLSEIKARLNDKNATFNEITCVLAHYKLQNKKNMPHQS